MTKVTAGWCSVPSNETSATLAGALAGRCGVFRLRAGGRLCPGRAVPVVSVCGPVAAPQSPAGLGGAAVVSGWAVVWGGAVPLRGLSSARRVRPWLERTALVAPRPAGSPRSVPAPQPRLRPRRPEGPRLASSGVGGSCRVGVWGRWGVSPQDEAVPPPGGRDRAARAEPRRHPPAAPHPHPLSHSAPRHHPAPPAIEARPPARTRKTPAPPGQGNGSHRAAPEGQGSPARAEAAPARTGKPRTARPGQRQRPARAEAADRRRRRYASGRTTALIGMEPAPAIVMLRPGRGAWTIAPSPTYIPTWLASSK